jgi:membrane protein YqaA with SNARE-associated domain
MTDISTQEARQIAKEAYTYANPLVDSYRILHTWFVDRENPEFKAPINHLFNVARVFTSEDRVVQTPNSDTPSKPEPGEDNAQPGRWRAHLLVELIAVAVVAGAVLWLGQNYQPRSFLGRGLTNYRLWIVVLLVSGWGTAGSLIPYYGGQCGTKAVFDHYPKLEGRPWKRLKAVFQRWGARALILSCIPGLGAALFVAAGAFGIGRPVFLCWVFVGKVLRYWVLVFAILFSLQFVG